MKQPRKSRNRFAIAAQFRNSAGAIPDQKKEESKTFCRKTIQEDAGEEAKPFCKVWDFCHHPELCTNKCFDEDLLKEKK